MTKRHGARFTLLSSALEVIRKLSLFQSHPGFKDIKIIFFITDGLTKFWGKFLAPRDSDGDSDSDGDGDSDSGSGCTYLGFLG